MWAEHGKDRVDGLTGGVPSGTTMSRGLFHHPVFGFGTALFFICLGLSMIIHLITDYVRF